MKSQPSLRSQTSIIDPLLRSFKSFGQPKDVEKIIALGQMIEKGYLVFPPIENKQQAQLLFLTLNDWSVNLKGWNTIAKAKPLSPEIQESLKNIIQGMFKAGCGNWMNDSDWNDAWAFVFRIQSPPLWEMLYQISPPNLDFFDKPISHNNAELTTAQWALRMGQAELLSFVDEKGWTPKNSQMLWENAFSSESLEWLISHQIPPPPPSFGLAKKIQYAPRTAATAQKQRESYVKLIENYPEQQTQEEALIECGALLFEQNWKDVESVLNAQKASYTDPILLKSIIENIYKKNPDGKKMEHDLTQYPLNGFSFWSYHAKSALSKEVDGVLFPVLLTWVLPTYRGWSFENINKIKNLKTEKFQDLYPKYLEFIKGKDEINETLIFEKTLDICGHKIVTANPNDALRWAIRCGMSTQKNNIDPLIKTYEKILEFKSEISHPIDDLLLKWVESIVSPLRLNPPHLDFLKSEKAWENGSDPIYYWMFDRLEEKIKPETFADIQKARLNFSSPASLVKNKATTPRL